VLPPVADMIAEDDAACDYHQHLADRLPRWGTALPAMEMVTAGAWAFLCPADVELRQPRRRPFAPESD